MAYKPMSEERKAVLKRVAKDPGGSWRVIAENYTAETGHFMRKQTAHKMAEKYGFIRKAPPKTIPKNPMPVNRGDSITQDDIKEKSKFEMEVGDDKIVFRADGARFTNFDELLKYGKSLIERDWGQWKVGPTKFNSWDVTISASKSSTDRDVTYTNYQIAITLLPKKMKEMAIAGFVDRLRGHALPRIECPNIVIPKTNPLSVVVGVTDHHFGLYCWAAETGQDYDLEIASKLYVDAFRQLIDHASRWGKVVDVSFPVGSDLFHINDPTNTTPSFGHALDVDSRLAKVIETVQDALVEAIEYAASNVPQVRPFWIPGNHDPESSFWMTKIVKAYFRNTKHVLIDDSPKQRKFVAFGKNLIMFAHGDKVPIRDFPTLMFSEEPELCGKALYREILIGHKHKNAMQVWDHTNSFGMFVVRTLPSLIARDMYHYEHGYIGTPRSAEGYVYDSEMGYRGHYPVFANHLIDARKLQAP